MRSAVTRTVRSAHALIRPSLAELKSSVPRVAKSTRSTPLVWPSSTCMRREVGDGEAPDSPDRPDRMRRRKALNGEAREGTP